MDELSDALTNLTVTIVSVLTVISLGIDSSRILGIIMVFVIFYLFDLGYKMFKDVRFFRRFVIAYLKRFQKKIDKFERKYESLGFFALVLFVAIPLPGTGAWSGCLISWLLGLDKKKSILAIASGVFIAGIFILLGTLGFIDLFF